MLINYKEERKSKEGSALIDDEVLLSVVSSVKGTTVRVLPVSALKSAMSDWLIVCALLSTNGYAAMMCFSAFCKG